MDRTTKQHSWWWDNHISPNNVKWLAKNLEEMDRSVERMLKLFEEGKDVWRLGDLSIAPLCLSFSICLICHPRKNASLTAFSHPHLLQTKHDHPIPSPLPTNIVSSLYIHEINTMRIRKKKEQSGRGQKNNKKYKEKRLFP